MKRNKKKLKKIIANVMLYTICWRNVDKLNDIWIYAKYDLLGGKNMEKFNLKDKVKFTILKCIDYDNKHHCFKWFAVGFCTSVIFVETLILLFKFIF